MNPLNTSEREELEALRYYASKSLMTPIDRAFFDLQKIIDNYPKNSIFNVLATAISELKREVIK